jgi:archaellum component FlaD/FlaE
MFDNFARMFSTNDSPPEDDGEDETEFQGLEAQESAGPDGGDDGPDVADLDVRLSELEEDIDSTESSLRTLRSSQQEIADSVEEMNETIRQLAGMYDRIAAQENPFVDGSANGSDVVGDQPDDPTLPDPEERTAEPERDHGDGEPTEDAGGDDGTVSFEDLQDDAATVEGATGPGGEQDEDGDGRQRGRDSARDGANGRGERGDGHDPAVKGRPAPSEEDIERAMTPGEQASLLEAVPDGYAGEMLVMEWLAMLMDQSGPAGALRAVEHYEDVGWISADTRDRLIDVIGGPALDVFVDPRAPRELSGEEHADSYGYLRVIQQLRDL